MNRRAVIASIVGGAVVLAGCTTSGSDSGSGAQSEGTVTATPESDNPLGASTGNNRIAVDDRRVAPGETGTVVIKAREVATMTVSPSLNNPVPLDYENASFSKHSKIMSVAQSYPPQWHWSSPQKQVTVRVPFHVPDDAQPGAYEYSVTVSNESASDGVTEQFTMTVS